MNEKQLQKEILYIPMNPFYNDTDPIKLDLILYKDDDFGQFINQQKLNKILYYHPFPQYIHISDLKFYEVKNIKVFSNYFYCPIHKKLYNKYCPSTHEILCSECDDEGNIIEYFDKIELNWEKFTINKNKIINIILKLIEEFYPDKIKEFNKEEFCKIETEKIIIEKVNKKLYNEEYDKIFNDKLQLLILDFNSFIVSALKIYNTNKCYNKNFLYNLDLFENIDFPQIFNLDNDIY